MSDVNQLFLSIFKENLYVSVNKEISKKIQLRQIRLHHLDLEYSQSLEKPMLMFTEGVWRGSSRQRTSQGGEYIRPSCPPQQASDPLKGSTVCLCRETRPPQLSHRVAEGRKRQFLQVGIAAQRTGLGMREIGVWGKVPPGTNYGFYRPIYIKKRE